MEDGGSTGAITTSVIDLTALGMRWGIKKQRSFPVLLYYKSVQFLLSSVTCAEGPHSIPQHNPGGRGEERKEVVKW